jgi:hypothetical protein
MKYILLILLLAGCTKQREAQPLTNYLEPSGYYVYRVEINEPIDSNYSDTYYFTSGGLLDFLQYWSTPSPNIFDFNGSGVVDASDQLDVLAAFGEVYTPDFDITTAQVTGQFSSGWTLNLDGFTSNFAVLKVTPYDEGGTFIPDTLRSFFIEGDRAGDKWKVWYYAY